MKKQITKANVITAFENDCILRDYLSIKYKYDKDRDPKSQYLFITYDCCIIKITIYENTTAWWECNGYIYWLRAEQLNELLESLRR